MREEAEQLKKEILRLTREYSRITHQSNRPGAENECSFDPGKTPIPYAARVFTEDEVEAGVSSMLDFWLTLGPEGSAFEDELARYMGVKHTLLVNSGSSANLVALFGLTSHKLPESKRIRKGDEVITAAAGFPTTVAPIVQAGAIPVFLDNDPVTGNIRTDTLEEAFVPGKTRAVMVAHTLGNPFDLGAVLAFCKKHDLWLIEDNCDALGSTYSLPLQIALDLDVLNPQEAAGAQTRRMESPHATVDSTAGTYTALTGSFGDLATQSFYPPHHLTMGEGGAVHIVNRPPLKTYVESFRDWGRDCWCASGKDNTCGRRFEWQLGDLPYGYDHKYIYSHLGFNLKPLDPQAAIGRRQLKRLPAFINARKANWQKLRAGLAHLEEFFAFSLPTHARRWTPEGFEWDDTGCRSECSWFGFMLRVRDSAPFRVRDLAEALDAEKIGNRMLFGGNLVRQPAFIQLDRNYPGAFRIVGSLSGADDIMKSALFLGTYPGLTDPMITYIIQTISSFCKRW